MLAIFAFCMAASAVIVHEVRLEPGPPDYHLLEAEASDAFNDPSVLLMEDVIGLSEKPSNGARWRSRKRWSAERSKPIVELYHGQCERFIVLTMQRSGSTWAMDELNKYNKDNNKNIRATFEAFSFHPKQTGREIQVSKNLTTKQVLAMGSISWANLVFNEMTSEWEHFHTLTPPCAVGFKIMNAHGMFVPEEYYEMLLRTDIKKIIIKRENTYAQWFSMQRACFTDMWGGKTDRGYQKSVEETQHKINHGETCGAPGIANFTEFKERKNRQFASYKALAYGSPIFEINTEDLSTRWPSVVDFLLRKTPEDRQSFEKRRKRGR